MRYLLILITFGLLIYSCKESIPSSSNENEEFNDNPIVGKWKLHSKESSNPSNKMDLKAQPTEIILSLMDGGYFVIYDTFVDPRFNQKGFNRISERSKGQWEFIDNKRLILHHNFDDSTRIEELFVTLLNKNTLVTRGENKKSTIYKTYEGY